MTEPPSKLHELLALALDDYDVISIDSRYRIYMGFWHLYDKNSKVCYVCLAGCVIARTFKFPHTLRADPLDMQGQWTNALAYLNNLREGINPFTFFQMFTISDHQAYPEAWRTDMQHFLEYLQLENL